MNAFLDVYVICILNRHIKFIQRKQYPSTCSCLLVLFDLEAFEFFSYSRLTVIKCKMTKWSQTNIFYARQCSYTSRPVIFDTSHQVQIAFAYTGTSPSLEHMAFNALRTYYQFVLFPYIRYWL